MLHHNVISLHHSVTLVGKIVVVVRELRNEIIFDLVAEVVDEHTHIELVGCRLMVFWCKMGLPDDVVHIVQGHRNGIVPETLKLLLAIMHIVIVFHSHIELVARRLGGAEPLGAEVAATHDDPSVAVFAVVLGQAEVEFCMEVFSGVYAQLQATFRYVCAKLTDALVNLGRIFRLVDVTKEILAVLFQTHILVTKEEFASCL